VSLYNCDSASIQHYVTLSWFFRSVLDLETYESEAMELAGVLDPSVADRLTTVLPVEEQHSNDGDRYYSPSGSND